jgi:hypothetical protein
MRRIAGVSLCALMVTVCAVPGSGSERTRVKAAPVAREDACLPGSNAKSARGGLARRGAPSRPPREQVGSATSAPPEPRSGNRADLGHDQVVGMLADLHRTLLDRFGTSDEGRLDSDRRMARGLVVPVRFHVVYGGGAGRVSKGAARRQIATLNAAYSGRLGGADTRVRFRMTGYDRTNKASWFRHPQRYESPMKRRLRKGGPGTLNLFTAAVGSDVLGFSTFPQWYRRAPRKDGVVIDYRSLPHGSYAPFNHGYTAVHEIGHWFGLMHTFEGGCAPPGDGVADTPYEAEPAQGCPYHRDSCPQRGDDPVHNFMDYAHDACMSGFTAGQGRLVRASWAAYRSRGHGRHRVDLGTRTPGAARSVGGAR